MDMFLVRNSLKLLTVFDSEGVKIYMSADLCPSAFRPIFYTRATGWLRESSASVKQFCAITSCLILLEDLFSQCYSFFIYEIILIITYPIWLL